MLHISNSAGIKTSDVLEFYIGATHPEFIPSAQNVKWVNIRGEATAYLEIHMSGYIKLSCASQDIAAGIWISLFEAYI